MEKRVVVAIDGPAGAGKSTMRGACREAGVCLHRQRGHVPGVRWRRWPVARTSTMAERLEQLARATRIEFEPGGARVLLDGET